MSDNLVNFESLIKPKEEVSFESLIKKKNLHLQDFRLHHYHLKISFSKV